MMAADLADLEAAIRLRASEIVANASQVVLDATQAACPLGESQALRDSHFVDPPIDGGDTISADIHVDAPHAVFVAEGTRPHEIRPNRAKALRFEVGGSVVFAHVVHHPGTQADTEWWSQGALQERWTAACEAEAS